MIFMNSIQKIERELLIGIITPPVPKIIRKLKKKIMQCLTGNPIVVTSVGLVKDTK